MKIGKWLFLGAWVFGSVPAWAITARVVEMHAVDSSTSKSIGYVVLSDTKKGLLIRPHLHGLPKGVHGFHVHEYASCADHGMAAGGHLDPQHTDKHLGPYNKKGHLGDLPVLIVNKDGTATRSMLAPRLKVSEIIGHSLMIHAGGDNYSDKPKSLGGGGARLACGVVRMPQNHIHAQSIHLKTN